MGEGAPRPKDEEEDEGEQKEEEAKEEAKMVREAEKRRERVGRSLDFLWGRMCVGGRG